MNNLLHNLAVIFIFIGIISLTIYFTRVSYVREEDIQKVFSDRPSRTFDKMFNQPEIWMGYADNDTKDKINQQPIPGQDFKIKRFV